MPPLPSISQGQMALDPVNQIIYYKTQSDELKSVTLKWLQDQDQANLVEISDTIYIGGDLTVTGNLTINGTTTTLNVSQVYVEDNFLILNSNVTGAPITNAGLEVERGSLSNVSIRWNEGTDKWEWTNNGTVYNELGSVLENAVQLGYHTVGNYVKDIVSGTGISVAGGASEGSTNIININAAIDQLNDVSTASATPGQFLQYDGSNWVNSVFPSSEPIGHEDKTKSYMSFNDSTRQFSISPVNSSHIVWCVGKRFIKTTTETITIPDETNLYYIYYNSSGVLSYKTTFFTWDQDTPTAYIYWNADDNKAYFFADERHGVTLDWATHEYLHRTRGAAIANGFGVNNYTITGDGTSNADAQIEIANGTFFDEDLQVDIIHSATPSSNTWEQFLQGPAKIPIFYKVGSHWVKDTATDFPLKLGTSRPKYNLNTSGTWSTPDIANNRFGITFLIATNNLNEPIIGVLGQDSYTDKGSAEATFYDSLDLTAFPIVEFRSLYKLVYECKDSFTNTPKAAFVEVTDLRINSTGGLGVPTVPVSDHGTLTGLSDDDHPQYFDTARHDAHDHTTALGSSSITDLSDVNTSGVTLNSVLKWDGSNWVPIAKSSLLALDDLSDVSTTGATANYFLKNNGSSWIASQVQLAEEINLTELKDVNTTGAVTDNVLKYNGSSWVAGIASTVAALNDLTDVNTAGVATNDYLKWNGSSWVPATISEVLSLANLSDVVISSASTNQIIKYNGSNWTNATPDHTFAANAPLSLSSNNLYFRPTISTVTTGRNITSADVGKILLASATSPSTVALTFTSSTGFSVGDSVDVVRTGTGAVSVSTSGGGVTLNKGASLSSNLRETYSSVTIICTASNEYLLIGDLAAV